MLLYQFEHINSMYKKIINKIILSLETNEI